MMRTLFVISFALIIAIPAKSQFIREIPPELQKLEWLMGDWVAEGEITIAGKTSAHTSHHQVRWVLKKRLIEERMTATFPNGGPMDGLRWLTYDSKQGHYTSYWIDVQLETPITKTGQLKGPRELVLIGSMTWKDQVLYFESTYLGREDGTLQVTHALGTDKKNLRVNSQKIWRKQSP